MIDMARKRVILLTSLATVIFIVIFYRHSEISFPQYVSKAKSLALPPANATLGFGALLAVSGSKPPRRAGLLYAANLTDLAITIPSQPSWTDADIENFHAKNGKSELSRGSTSAWMGHLNALRWFLSTSLETALILEDEVDFSIQILTIQAPLAAAAVRTLLSSSSSLPGVKYSPHHRAPDDADYWAPPSSWEILYLGYCSNLTPPFPLDANPHLAYHDPTVLSHSRLNAHTSSLLAGMGILEETRLVYKSHWPLCTFSYAVTRASAQRMLKDFGSEAREDGAGTSAYDVWLLEACRDRVYKCWTVIPELFHNSDGETEIAVQNGDGEERERDE